MITVVKEWVNLAGSYIRTDRYSQRRSFVQNNVETSGATMYNRDNEVIQGGLAVIGHTNVRIGTCEIDNLTIRDCAYVDITGCIIDYLSVENCNECTISGNIINNFNLENCNNIMIMGNIGEEDNIQVTSRVEKYYHDGIKIGEDNGGWFFTGKWKEKYEKYTKTRCDDCSMTLSSKYVYIIEKLKESSLLDKNHPKLCCNCYARNNR